VEWYSLPAKYIHGVLVGYQMNFTRDKTNVTKVLNIRPNVTNYHVTGLERYAPYVISLAAVNEVGVGVFSHDVIAWTDEAGKFCLAFVVKFYQPRTNQMHFNWYILSILVNCYSTGLFLKQNNVIGRPFSFDQMEPKNSFG